MSEGKKKSMKVAAWAMMANMPLMLKAEITLKMLLAGSDERKQRDNAQRERKAQADPSQK